MKPGSDGGSEGSEGYLSASDERVTPNLSSPPHHPALQAPPPLSHVPYPKSENQGIALPPTSTPPNDMGQQQPIQGTQPAMHPLASSLAANQNRLKSPTLGQSPPQIHSMAPMVTAPLDHRSSPMATSRIMTSVASMTSSGQISPTSIPSGYGAHSGTLKSSAGGYHRITGQGMALPLANPLPPTCSNSNSYTQSQGSYMNAAPKLTHL